MFVRELQIRHFRCFSNMTIKPKGHVVVMGEPGAGRSGLVEALRRVLDVEANRARTITELDFYNGDVSQPTQITLTLGGLGEVLEQDFFDQLDIWDKSKNHLIMQTDRPGRIDEDFYEWVLRIAYQARWLSQEDRFEERVFYPKSSDPDTDSFAHTRRRDIEKLEFSLLQWSGTKKILDLGSHSNFRRLINSASGGDFTEAITQYVDKVGQAAGQFSKSVQVQSALERVIAPLRELHRISETDLSQLFQFAPEGGSLSGLLRSLSPAIDFGVGTGSLPAWRHGSTTAALFRIAETLALSSGADKIISIDDLGDGLDAASSAHLATVIRRSTGQAWITTRTPAVAEAFEPQEVVRLGRDASGAPFARQGRQTATKAEAVASRHWHRNLIPALTYRSVVVVEGPHDFSALHNLALRRSNELGLPLPAGQSVAFISAGAGGTGGYVNVLKLTKAAKEIGLRAIAAIDGDKQVQVQEYLAKHEEWADVIIRLPDGCAIEAAITHGISDAVMKQAIRDIATAADLDEPANLENLVDKKLNGIVIQFLKSKSMHGPFIDALPTENLPVQILNSLVKVAAGTQTGLIQLGSNYEI